MIIKYDFMIALNAISNITKEKNINLDDKELKEKFNQDLLTFNVNDCQAIIKEYLKLEEKK